MENPFPPDQYPDKTDSNRRYVHYRGIARLLLELAGYGCTNALLRAKLPPCVYARISEDFGESIVGFKEVSQPVTQESTENTDTQASSVAA